MKVTFCAYDNSNGLSGGPNAWLRRLLASLKAKGVEISVLFIISKGDISECANIEAIKALQVTVEYIYWKDYPTTEDKIQWILECIKVNPPDIFVPNLMVSAYYAAKWIKKAGIPTVGFLHSDDTFHHSLLDEFVAGPKDFVLTSMVAPSKWLEEKIVMRNPNNILVERLPYGAIVPVRKAVKPVDKFRIIYVGRLVEPQKRIQALTHAFCKVVTLIPDTEAIIYGDGPEKENIVRIIDTYDMNGAVRLGGAIDNRQMQEVMLQAHMFVLLSDYEGLPIALMEAMACGLVPVCLREESGIKELIIHNENGLIVENREDSFENAVRHLIQEEGLWSKLSMNARRTIEKEYSHEMCADKWLNFLQKLSANRKRPPRTIKLPDKIILPPLNQGLVREDRRKIIKRKPNLLKKIKNKFRLRVRIKDILQLFKK